MTAFLIRMAFTVLRHVLTGIGASLVGDGILTNDQSSQAVGAVMTMLGIAWAAYQAHADHKNAVAVQGVAAQKSNDLTGATVKTGSVQVFDLAPPAK